MQATLKIDGKKNDSIKWIYRADIIEGINVVSAIEVVFVTKEPGLKDDDFLGKTLELKLKESVRGKDTVTRFDGIVFEFGKVWRDWSDWFRKTEGKPRRLYAYRALARPKLWEGSLTFRSRIFADLAVLSRDSSGNVAEQVLKDIGYSESDYEKGIRKFDVYDDAKPEQIVQYRQTDLDFLERLLAQAGINYYFRADEKAENPSKLRLVDWPDGFNTGGELEVYPPPESGLATGKRYLLSLDMNSSLFPKEFEAIGFNPQEPSTQCKSDSKSSDKMPFGKVLLYGDPYNSNDQATMVRDRRYTELSGQQIVAQGTSDLFNLRTAARIKVAGKPAWDSPDTFLLTHVQHILQGSDSINEPQYANKFFAVPDGGNLAPSYLRAAMDRLDAWR